MVVDFEGNSSENSSESEDYDDGGSSSITNDNSELAIKDKEEQLARTESKAVFHLRVTVILVLLVASAAVSGLVYRITQQGQYQEYINRYTGASSKILDTFNAIVSEKMGAIGALAVATIAHGVDHSRDWPFVTLSSFQERCANARAQSGALFVELCPLVRDEDFWGWLDYSTQDEDNWIASAISFQQSDVTNSAIHDLVPNAASEINPGYLHYVNENGNVTMDIGPGPYMPVWETSPLIKSRQVNFNILREPGTSEDALRCFETASAVIGNAIDPSGEHSSITRQFLAGMKTFQARTETEYNGGPISQFFIPVFDSFAVGRKPVAVLTAYVEWMVYFEGILPNTTAEITLVLKNSCHAAYSFAIKGSAVEFIGQGDHHETKYESEKRSAILNDVTSLSDGTEFGIPIDYGNCIWSLSTYPSSQYYKAHNTAMPIQITFAVAAIFLFTAAMFFVYDRLVARRQKIIMRRAIKSSAIVASLFPKRVRDQLMQEKENSTKGTTNQSYMAPQHRLKSYLGGTHDEDLGQKPIAEVFPDATVMFCDIAGFTAWSSTRDPSSVFVLLQSVYQAFDEIAKRRKVFKVGDCSKCVLHLICLPVEGGNYRRFVSCRDGGS